MNTKRPFTFKKSREDGFTFVELLVVIMTVAILSVLLLPALAGTKPNSQAFQCLENLRQLTLAWQMYAEDNNGKLTPNCELAEQPQSITSIGPNFLPGGKYFQWCPGNVQTFNQYATNYIQMGAIYPFVNTVNVYHCPADQSVIKFGPLSFPKPRSYSMNCWLSPYPGKDATSIFGGPTAHIFNEDTDINQPKPSLTFVFIDENANSIDDGYFVDSPGFSNKWINVPSTRHGDASGLSFADGHVEIKAWRDSVVLAQNSGNARVSGGPTFPSDPSSGDNAWLEQRATSLIQ